MDPALVGKKCLEGRKKTNNFVQLIYKPTLFFLFMQYRNIQYLQNYYFLSGLQLQTLLISISVQDN